MSELKCPFCGEKLGRKNINDRMCSNEKCVSWKGNFYGSEYLWQELIRTRKALEWARHFLKEIRLRYLFEKDNPSRQNKWADTALCMYNFAEEFFDDYDKTNENKGSYNE